jgi:hypothetical protein
MDAHEKASNLNAVAIFKAKATDHGIVDRYAAPAE